MQISFVMLIFLLFSDQISGRAKVSEGEQTALGGRPSAPPPMWKKASRIFLRAENDPVDPCENFVHNSFSFVKIFE